MAWGWPPACQGFPTPPWSDNKEYLWLHFPNITLWWMCFLLASCDFMEIPVNQQVINSKRQRKENDEPEVPLLLYQDLNIWSLQSAVSSPSSLERKGQERPTESITFSIYPFNITLFWKMVNCGNLLKSALVATVLMAMIHSGSAGMTKISIKQVQDVTDVSSCQTYKIFFNELLSVLIYL